MGRLAGAARRYGESVRRAPDLETCREMGVCLWGMGDCAAAAGCHVDARRPFPKDLTALACRAGCPVKTGACEGALRCCDDSRRSDPEYPDARDLRGMFSQRRAGDPANLPADAMPRGAPPRRRFGGTTRQGRTRRVERADFARRANSSACGPRSGARIRLDSYG